MAVKYWKAMTLIIPAILLILSLPSSDGQEEAGTFNSTTFYLNSSQELTFTPASGSIPAPSFRMISGGRSESLGTWESDPVQNPITVGGSISISIRAGGLGSSISFSAAVYVDGNEIGSGESGESNLFSSTGNFNIMISGDEVVLQPGGTIAVEITFHARLSRGVNIELGEQTRMSIGTGDVPVFFEVHDHDGTVHVDAAFPAPWGISWISSATAAFVTEEGTEDFDHTEMEKVEGNVSIEWIIEEPPEHADTVIVSITDVSGNTYSLEGEMEEHDHDHDHGGIMISTGSISLLVIVIAGVVGIGYLGGITPLSSFFDERKMRYLLAFAAGVFIATALFHALPEAFEMSGWWALFFVALGFFTLYAIEHWVIDFFDKKFRKKENHHAHKHTGVALHLHDHHSKDHEILTDEDIDPADQVCSHHLENTSEAAFFGVSLHNLIEGIVITTLFMNPETQAVGLIVILATILHKAPCTFSIASLMKMAGNKPGTIKKKVLILLSMTPLGAVLALLLFMNLDAAFVGLALAFSAGTFLEIGILDLAPESLKPKRGWMLAAIAIGLGFVLLWLFSLVHVH